MPEVKVRRRGITADDTAAAIHGRLGDDLKITPNGDRELEVYRTRS